MERKSMTVENQPTPRPIPKLVESSVDDHASEPTAILVLGMHRSGTSALTRVVNLLGADLPRDLMPPKEDNAPGFWEAQDGHHLNDGLLESAGSRWDDWRPINPQWFQSAKARALRNQALDFLQREFADSPLFVLKDPRICRLLPFWLDVLEEFGRKVRVIVVFRNPLEVASSLRERNGLSSSKSHMLWLRHTLEAELATRRLPRAFLSYEELLDDWREAIGHMESGLGLSWPRWSATAEVDIDGFLNARHRHHSIALDRLKRHPKISGWVKEAADSLRDLLRDPWSSSAQSRLDWIHADFDRASDALGAILRSEEVMREEAEKAVARHEQKLTEATAALADSDSQLTALSEVNIANKKLIAEVQGAFDERGVQVGDLERQLASAVAERIRLSHELSQRVEQEVTLRKRLDAAESLSTELSSTLQSRDTRVADLERQLAARGAELEVAEERFARELEERVKKVEAQRDELERRAQKKGEELQALQSHLALRETRVGELEELHAESRLLTEELENGNRARDLMLENLRDALGVQNSRVSELVRQLSDSDQASGELAALLAHRDHQINNLNDAQRDTQVMARRLQESLDFQRGRVGELEQTLSSQEATLARLRKLLTEREQLLAEQMKSGSRVERDLGQVNSENFRLDVELAETKAAGAAMQKRVSELTVQRNQALHRLNALQKKRKYISGTRSRPPRKCFGSDLSLLQRSRLAKQAEFLMANRAFNESWYVETYPDVALSGSDPVWHWLIVGWKEGRNPNLYFDVEWYCRLNPDVTKADENPLIHYLNHGSAEGRDPGPLFSQWWYLTRNPDVVRAGVNPLLHYFSHGAKERRSINPLFDPRRYVEAYPSAIGKTGDPFAHYLKTGPFEDYEPGPLFDTRWYLEQNPDVVQSGLNPLVHYLKYGRTEGRKPNPWFDPVWYLDQYPDVAEAGLDPLEHYLVFGAADGRNPGPSFESRWYLDTYEHVAKSGVNPLVHYLDVGKAEGRQVKARPTAGAGAPGNAPTVASVVAALSEVDSRRPRVVFCSHDLKVQGAPKSLFEVVTGLAARGQIEPIVLSPYDGPLRMQYEARGVLIAVVESGNVWNGKTAERFHRAVDVFMNAFAAINPAVVFANTFTMFHAISAAQHLGLPGMLNPRESEPPETFFDEFPEDIRSIAYRVIRTADKVVFVADATRMQWEFANERQHFTVIRNALPAEPEEFVAARVRDREIARRAFGIGPDDIVFACVGTVTPRKGQLDIVEAYARLPEHVAKRSRLLILGMAPNTYSEEVAALVATMMPARRGRVALIPQTNSDAESSKVRDVYLAADVFILSSRIESYPRVILEALSYGLPIITTPCFGVVEQVRDGKEALYYNEGDAEDLAIRMKILVDEPAFRNELAQAVVKRCLELGTHEDMLKAYEAAICSVIPSGGDGPGAVKNVSLRPDARSLVSRTVGTATVPLLNKGTFIPDRLGELQWLALISAEDHLLTRYKISLGLASYADIAMAVTKRAMPWWRRAAMRASAVPDAHCSAAAKIEIRPDPAGGIHPVLADLLSSELCAAAAMRRSDKTSVRLSLGIVPGQSVLSVIGSESAGEAVVPDDCRRLVIPEGQLVSPELYAEPTAGGSQSDALDAILAADAVCLAGDSAALPLALAACVALDRPLVVLPSVVGESVNGAPLTLVAQLCDVWEELRQGGESRSLWLSQQASLHQERCNAAKAWLQCELRQEKKYIEQDRG